MAGPYFVKSGTGGTDDGSSWANAAESIYALTQVVGVAVAGGETIYVHNTHDNQAAANIVWTLPESSTGIVRILSVDGGDATGASLSGTTVGNLYAGAKEVGAGDYAILIQSRANAGVYIYGLSFTNGGAGGGADITFGGEAAHYVLDTCQIYVNSTSNGANCNVGFSKNGHIDFINCSFRFANTSGSGIVLRNGKFAFTNCWIHADGSTPSNVFKYELGYNGETFCEGCDWSKSTYVTTFSSSSKIHLRMNNCIISTPTSGTHPGLGGNIVEFQGCATSSPPDILSYYYQDAFGVIEDSLATAGVYLTTGGAEGKNEDGTSTKYSLKMSPSTLVSTSTPLYTPWFYTNVASTGDKTVTMKVATATTALTTAEVWMEVEYMGEPGLTGTQRDADSPQSMREVDDNAHTVSSTLSRDILATGTSRTDTTEAWSSNNADWTAAVAHTLTASINIAEQGYIRCRVGLAKDQDTYVDPKVNVS